MIHGSACLDDPCAYCRGRIADAENERDLPEPLSPGEEARLDNAYQRDLERCWP